MPSGPPSRYQRRLPGRLAVSGLGQSFPRILMGDPVIPSEHEALMPISVLVAMVAALVLVSACTQGTPVASPESSPSFAPSPTKEATPTPTDTPGPPSPTPQPTAAPVPTSTREPAPSSTTQPTPTPEPTEEPGEPTVYVTAQEITGYSSPEGEEIGHIIPGKSFTVLEEQDGWLRIRLEAGGEGWIQASETAYYPEGQVPPTPEPQPYPACEAPHFGGRTEDRKTGRCIFDGDYRPQIYDPDTSPYAPYYNGAYWTRLHIPGYDWIYRRDARIISIDPQTGVIDFYVGSGVTVKRQFTEATKVVMSAHEWYIGMPMTDAFRRGGNLCDLEAEDMAALLHPTLGEAQYLDPNLTDLWGVLIVQ
jgi:hypothetical protein